MQCLADVATINLLRQRAIERGEALTEQLHQALNNRIIIEQAKGIIAQAHRVSLDVALARIRGYARCTNRRLADVAHQVVTGLRHYARPR